MNAKALLQAGKLNEAIEALGAELRDNPGDVQRRTFLFELLCFAGNYDRAEKQLNALAQDNPNTDMGSLLYRSALHAERTRQQMFQKGDFPLAKSASPRLTGTLNGKPFEALEDADGRIGARLELFAAGAYTWVPFQHIVSIEMQPPKRLRDLMWSPAVVRTGAGFEGMELGEVLLPAIAPLSWRHADDAVRLGRATEWQEVEGAEEMTPVGQKLLLVDDEDFPFLELRHLQITPVEAT